MSRNQTSSIQRRLRDLLDVKTNCRVRTAGSLEKGDKSHPKNRAERGRKEQRKGIRRICMPERAFSPRFGTARPSTEGAISLRIVSSFYPERPFYPTRLGGCGDRQSVAPRPSAQGSPRPMRRELGRTSPIIPARAYFFQSPCPGSETSHETFGHIDAGLQYGGCVFLPCGQQLLHLDTPKVGI